MLSRLILIGVAGVIVLGAISSDREPLDGPSSFSTSDHAAPPDSGAKSRSAVLPALTPIGSHERRRGGDRISVPPHAFAGALDPDDCFACHDDNTLSMDRGGVDISLFVDPGLYARAAHNSLDCVNCHVGFDPDEEPHLDEIVPVDCSTCHNDVQNAHSRGGHSGELACTACHGDVHVPRVAGREESLCQDCHEKPAADLAMSAHATGAAAASCVDCHAPHRFLPAESSACLACHGDAAFAAEHAERADIDAVLSYEKSIHGEMIECADCHEGHLVFPIDDPRSVVSRVKVSATCAECHSQVAEHYEKSEHAKALATNFAQAPTCTDCHGEHNIREVSDAESPMSRPREVQVCLDCHLDSPEVQERMTHTKAFVASYEWSVHGRAAASGNLEAAICSDCHGAHDAMKASNPEALINKFNIAETCGGCHGDVKTSFSQSIHGVALANGVGDAPTCTTCHSEHDILKTADSQSPVALINVSEDVCAPCHESFKLSEKYGFPSDRAASFSDSYHGLAGRFGSAESANCASCHGVHDIHPSSDPRSTVHPANLEATCGSCHPGATANFAKGSVHVIRTPEGDQVLYWIGAIYIGIIMVTIGGMTLHNLLDWFRKTKLHYNQHRHPVARPISEDRRTGLFVRMTLNERIQHALLASSFLLLVFTGFMLKFPEAWWVVLLRDLVGDPLFNLRSLLHRIAAVVLVADSIYHIYYVAFTQRGRRFISDILLRKSDFVEMVQMVRFNLGLTSRRPRFDRFNYIEKSEYWALIWGTILMTVTGVVLWFENHFMGHYSKLFVDINQTIHYYEAWLAFLAIVVWHFYYVIFNPDVYPLNFTFITGKMTEHDMAHEHPVELERIKDQEAATSGGDENVG